MSSSYVAIRDDTGQKSLSLNERDFLHSCALHAAAKRDDDDDDDYRDVKVLRCDGRRGNDVRNVRMQLCRWDNGSECTVQWGAGTRVTSLISAELVPPSIDRSNEGILNFTVDISPMSSASFRLAPAISTIPSSSLSTLRGSNHSDQSQRLLSNRILRCIERIILIGGALDTEALVLQASKWVWKITVSLTVLDAGGNILDACVLAAIAVLRHYRKPQVDLSDGGDGLADFNSSTSAANLPTIIPSIIKEATPLPLHHTPLSISFGLISADDVVNSTSSTSIVSALVDPTDREELVQSGSLTIAMNIHSEICLIDYEGGCELTPNKFRKCWKVAETSIKNLCQLLEAALARADEQAQKERLQRLQLKNISLPPLAPSNRNVPFYKQTDNEIDMDVDDHVDEAKVQQYQTEAEEAYRRQALDYSSGHVATSVREDDNNRKGHNHGQKNGSLLADMLKSVQKSLTLTVDDSHRVTNISTASKSSNNEDPPRIDNNAVKMDTIEKALEIKTPQRKDAANIEGNMEPKHQPPTAMALDDGDDDEEEITMLQNEFGSEKQIPSKEKEQVKTSATVMDESAGAEIDDLSMAIKKKIKKKKKSKKK